jgi:FkbM family methyltransferase
MPGLQRRVRDLVSREALHHVRYIPRIATRVENWPEFLMTYMRLSERTGVYTLRPDGLRIRTAAGVDASTVAVVFIKEDYGTDLPGGVIVDIGANIGAFSLLAARNPTATVYAYEPVRTTFELLEQNIALNGIGDRVHPFNLGVTARREERGIAIDPNGSPFNSLYGPAAETVRCVGLDDILADNAIETCDLLKLDCEGAEFEILYGASAATLSRIQRICLEYHEQPAEGFRANDLVGYLGAHGFRLQSRFDPTEPSATLWLDRAPESEAPARGRRSRFRRAEAPADSTAR